MGILVIVELFLPPPIAFDPNLDTSEYHFLPTAKIYAKLDHVAIIHGEGSRFDVRLAETYVIQESPRRAFDIFHMPLPLAAPELAMSSAHDFGFEADRGG